MKTNTILSVQNAFLLLVFWFLQFGCVIAGDLSCAFEKQGEKVCVKIRNDSSSVVFIHDQFTEEVPGFTLLRLCDKDGDVLTGNGVRADGFWTPKFRSSSLQSLPVKMVRIDSLETRIVYFKINPFFEGLPREIGSQNLATVEVILYLYLDEFLRTRIEFQSEVLTDASHPSRPRLTEAE